MVKARDTGSAATILLVGAGQIGSRHLQGLARSALELSIEILDPSSAARELAMQRFNEVPSIGGRKTSRAISSLNESAFREHVDLAIVATGAAARYAAFEAIVTSRQVSYVIFEKVLFQRLSELRDAAGLIAAHGCKAWVNCPRRMFPVGRQLRELFAGDVLSMNVQGGGWGLACNGIHFLDFTAYLSGSSTIDQWNIDLLDPRIYDSKRAGCKEAAGRLTFRLKGGHEISMRDDRGSAAPVVIDILGHRARVTLFETGRLMVLCRSDNQWKAEIIKIEIPLQSENTGKVVDALMATGRCELTPYDESSELHAAYLRALCEHMRDFADGYGDVCPIS